MPKDRPIRSGPGFAAALVALLAFWAIGFRYLDGHRLDLGSVNFPAPGHLATMLVWAVCGAFAAVAAAGAAARAVRSRYGVARFAAEWEISRDRSWLLCGSLAALLIPLAARVLLLRGAPLTDDESVYRFTAQLLAGGRLVIASHPLKLFFDHTLLVNDGRMFGAYFIGWPALAVPGIWLGAPAVMNQVLAAATVPPLFFILRRAAGSAWAKAGIVLYLGAPLLLVAAATELAHTSCLAALTWCAWFALRSGDERAPPWSHAGLAACFVVAFFVRPLTALGIALPLLVRWAWRLRKLPRREAGAAILAFAAPAALGAALFFGVNRSLYGGWLTTGYDAYSRYAEENDYRFATFMRDQPETVLGMRFDGLAGPLANSAVALLRLNFDLFGWPCSFFFAAFAAGRRARLPALLFASFAAFHFFLADSGVDSFGPNHWIEAALPILWLSILGLERLAAAWPPGLAPALFGALLLTSWLGYVPVRFSALHRIGSALEAPHRAVEAVVTLPAVVFAPWPFAPSCRSAPTHHYVFQRPISDPELSDPIVWANHLSVRADQELMAHFPGRAGYILHWTRECAPQVLPLAGLAPDAVPNGTVSVQR
jgi:hypothetical protein